MKGGINMYYKFEIFKDAQGSFRFRFRAPNGQIMFTCGEGYSSKQACKDTIDSIKKNAVAAIVTDLT